MLAATRSVDGQAGPRGLLVLLLAGMVVMVFGNVVLRYGFNSGAELFSEEMSRYMFVWRDLHRCRPLPFA